MKASNYTPITHREGYKIIQSNLAIHCNLQSRFESLDVCVLKRFLGTSFEEGYTNLNISGIEPFNYNGIQELLKFTNEAGFYTSVNTYESSLETNHNQDLLQYINLVRLSLGGKKEDHNNSRHNPYAFDQLQDILELLKENKTKFGFIHFLHNEPTETLKWICDFAMEHQAKVVQLHPIAKSVRSKSTFNPMALSDELRHKFFVLYHFYKLKHQDDFDLKLDLLHRNIVMQYPQLAYQFVYEDISDTNFYRELYIDEEGFVLPVSYGFTKHLAFGNIYENISLKEMMTRYHDDKLQQLKNIYLKVYQNIVDHPENLIFNYSELVINESRGLNYAHPENMKHYNYGVC